MIPFLKGAVPITVIKTLLKALVTILLVGFLASRIDFHSLSDILAQTSPGYLLGAAALLFLRTHIASWRWQLFLEALGHRVSLMRLFRYTFIGCLYNFFLPSSVGGDIARGTYIFGQGVTARHAASSILLDRVLALSSLAVICLIALQFQPQTLLDIRLQWAVLAVLGAGLAGYFTLTEMLKGRIPFNWAIPDFILRRLKALFPIPETPCRIGIGLTMKTFAISLLGHAVNLTIEYLVLRAVTPDIQFLTVIALSPVVWIVSQIPVTIGGHGLRENAFVLLYASSGLSTAEATGASLLIFALLVFQGVVGAGFFWVEKNALGPARGCTPPQQP